MASELFGIDEIDRNIIQLIQKEPTLTHTEIAKQVNRSQPTIGMRIRKLEELGILKFQAGINVKTTDLILARVEVQTLNPPEIIKLVKKCPYMLNVFRLSGSSNLSVLMASPKLKHLDQIVNRHFRKNPDVLSVYIDVITEIIEDFVLNFNFNFDKCSATKDGQCCGKCINQNSEI
ncbi:MAG: Lrp/AsnC family transcriptional regulator [Promethearchaeota archaeon]